MALLLELLVLLTQAVAVVVVGMMSQVHSMELHRLEALAL
jgi:hypothetical protein